MSDETLASHMTTYLQSLPCWEDCVDRAGHRHSVCSNMFGIELKLQSAM